MAISANNVIVVYNSTDPDSEAFADHYVARHGLTDSGPDSQKVGIATSSLEILPDAATFNSSLLDPLKIAIDAIELAGRQVFAVVLGYRVPGGFYDGSDVISATSRISRINHAFNKSLNNFLFDRRVFKDYDAIDKDFALVCSRIDAPTLSLAQRQVDIGEELNRQFFVEGTFYLDPYSDRQGFGASEYQQALLDFSDSQLPTLNLNISETVFLDPYIDVVIPSVTNDSFVWSWFTNRGSFNFFKSSNAIRTFFYNADYDGAFTVRDIDERRWPVLAIRSEYMATAGAMSNPGNDGLLFPRPFFDALLRGATIGEAYLFSVPFLDWTMTLFGDPLVSFSFPVREADDLGEGPTDRNESVRLMSMDLARSIAYRLKKQSELENSRDRIVASTDVATEVDLLSEAQRLFENNSGGVRESEYAIIVNQFFEFIINIQKFVDVENVLPTVDEYLTSQGFGVSELLTSILRKDDVVSASNILEVGSWQVELPIIDDALAFALYHFHLQVSDQEDFSNIVIDVNSQDDQVNWLFEKDENDFIAMTELGVASRFIGQRVRYESKESEILTRGTVYYFRLRQLDQQTNYSFRTFTDIIYT